MRLVCPNCSAQYEIDGSMIPDEGRDVQCSNCGHTWFELPPPPSDLEDFTAQDFEAQDDLVSGFDNESDAAEPEVGEQTGYDDPDAGSDDENDQEPLGRVSDIVAEAASSEETDEDGDLPMPGAIAKKRRPADAAALDVLREEAEREMSQRRATPTESLETQTDLGLSEANQRTPSRALRARIAHLGEEDVSDAVEDQGEQEPPVPAQQPPTVPQKRAADTEADDGYKEPRRDLLPDINEINSTLKSTRRRDVEDRAGRGGFLSGFLLMLAIAFGLIIAYSQAPAITRLVPGSESFMISYVDYANVFRDWLAGLING